jgi:hypothetical protein
MKIVLCCLLLAILFHPGQVSDQSAQPFRIIPIPTRENGYGNFPSVVLMSQKDLDSFLTNTSTQSGWNHRQEFENALLSARVDFSKEALVLLRHTEGSGSVKVTFEMPVLQDRNLICEIRGKAIHPGHGGTDDMAYYCFAVAVSKTQIRQVELRSIKGGVTETLLAPIVLPIIERDSANNQWHPSVTKDVFQGCPTISVSCPSDLERNKPVKFQASIIGGKPNTVMPYGWSVSKGKITFGQGTAVIEVEVTDMDYWGLTATVEVSGFHPECPRVASCTTAVR